jgi:hypothetical protein
MGILKAIQAIFDSSSSEQFAIANVSTYIQAQVQAQVNDINAFIKNYIMQTTQLQNENRYILQKKVCTLINTIKINKISLSSKITGGNTLNSYLYGTPGTPGIITKHKLSTTCPEGFANNCSGGSWFYEIFHTIIALFALYLSFQCNGGFDLGAFLLACICPYIYIPYVLFTHSDRCGLQWVQKILGGVSRPPSY